MVAAPSTAPSWRSDLLPRLAGLPLLPVGAGKDGKAPIDVQTGLPMTGWQSASWGAAQIAATDPAVVTAVGMRCGPDAGGLVAFDLDGESALAVALEAGCKLGQAGWLIQRRTAGDRCKVVFRVPPEHWPAEGSRRAGKAVRRTGDNEQIEVFWGSDRGCQIVVAGLHKPSGAFLEWRGGPEGVTDIPPAWLALWESLEAEPVTSRPAAAAMPEAAPVGAVPLLELLPAKHEALARSGCAEGGRDEACFELAAVALATAEGAAAAGLEVAGTVEALVLDFAARCSPRFPEREALKCLRSAERQERTPDPGLADRIAYQRRKDSRGSSTATWEPQPQAAALIAPAMSTRKEALPLPATFSWLIRSLPSGWTTDKDGVEKASKLSAGRMAEMLPADRLRFNEMSLLPEVHTLSGWQPIKDADADSAYVLLSQKGWIIGVDPLTKAICHVARLQSFHPVRAYLLELEQNDSITPFNLDHVAPQFFRADRPLHVAMVRKWLIGAVARALNPGCQMDYALVLQSDQQGLGKSTGFEVLASPDWFNSTVPDADKDFLLNVHSCWIFELAELEHVTGARAEGRMKNLITTKSDLIRVPYGRTPERMKRASVFCGTVNAREFLRDETGDRRYWVVPIEGTQRLDRDGLKASRDAIWKAAVIAYRSGELPMLSDEHAAESEEQNANYRREDPWLSMLQAWIDGNPMGGHVNEDGLMKVVSPLQPFTTAEALYSAGLKRPDQIQKPDENRVAPLLRRLGFEKRQQMVKGRRRYVWQAGIAQPAQPCTTSPDGGCAVKPVALQGIAQPAQRAQPISRKPETSPGEPPAAPRAEMNPLLGSPEVVHVVHPPSEALQRSGSGVHNPPDQEVVHVVQSGQRLCNSDRIPCLLNGEAGWSRKPGPMRGLSVLLTHDDGHQLSADPKQVTDLPPGPPAA